MTESLLNKVSAYIRDSNLFGPESKILVAVSGGIDSVCLLDILVKLGNAGGVAHCNFSLRADESDGDEQFVGQLANNYQLTFFTTRFDTRWVARTQEVSVQMAARTLRYDWFETIRAKHKFTHIAIAHTLNDSIETFFINLIRGTGIRGLTGISPVNGYVVRPLLSVTRADLEAYAKTNNLSYREDSSNASTRYTRNYIRHKVVPSLLEVAPSFYTTFSENIDRLKDVEIIYTRFSIEATKGTITHRDGKMVIDLAKLRKVEAFQSVLFEILSGFGFSSSTCSVISRNLEVQSGSQFHSETHLLVKHGDTFIIAPKQPSDDAEYYVNQSTVLLEMPVRLRFERVDNTSGFVPVKDKRFAFFDSSKLHYPLTIRRWKEGDRFVPFGMTGMKKLSDFFTDTKASFFHKRDTWLLCSGNDIIWVVGQRTDNRYRVQPDTRQILSVQLL